jgi:hypothetical protein
LKAAAQHAACEKEEAIYYPCKLCNNNMMYLYKDHEIIYKHLDWSSFMDNYFIWSKHDEKKLRTQSIVYGREEENINVSDHMYSHHDNRCEDDVGQDVEGVDVEELMPITLVIVSSNGPCDVTLTHFYCDWALLLVT